MVLGSDCESTSATSIEIGVAEVMVKHPNHEQRVVATEAGSRPGNKWEKLKRSRGEEGH